VTLFCCFQPDSPVNQSKADRFRRNSQLLPTAPVSNDDDFSPVKNPSTAPEKTMPANIHPRPRHLTRRPSTKPRHGGKGAVCLGSAQERQPSLIPDSETATITMPKHMSPESWQMLLDTLELWKKQAAAAEPQ